MTRNEIWFLSRCLLYGAYERGPWRKNNTGDLKLAKRLEAKGILRMVDTPNDNPWGRVMRWEVVNLDLAIGMVASDNPSWPERHPLHDKFAAHKEKP